MKFVSPSLPTVILTAAVAFSGCAAMAGGQGGGGGLPPGIGEPAPDITVAGFWDKKPIRLSSYRGKVVLLDIWASWCVPCKDELPALDAMANRLRGKGIEVVAVSVDEERPAAEAFVKTRKQWQLTLAHDPSGTVADRLQPTKMPTTYVIDAAGLVRHVNAGYYPGDVEKLEAQLLALAK